MGSGAIVGGGSMGGSDGWCLSADLVDAMVTMGVTCVGIESGTV